MTKSDLVEKLSEALTNLTKKECEVIVDTVFLNMKDALHRGEKIEIRGFGGFTRGGRRGSGTVLLLRRGDGPGRSRAAPGGPVPEHRRAAEPIPLQQRARAHRPPEAHGEPVGPGGRGTTRALLTCFPWSAGTCTGVSHRRDEHRDESREGGRRRDRRPPPHPPRPPLGGRHEFHDPGPGDARSAGIAPRIPPPSFGGVRPLASITGNRVFPPHDPE